MASETLIFDDVNSVQDLSNFLSRARTIEDDAARMTAQGNALAVYVPVVLPGGLGQGQCTVLAMRVHRLIEPAELDAVFALGSISDRLARMGESSTEFSVPPAEATPSWAGISVPVSGWQRIGVVADDELSRQAKIGIEAVNEALPENAGRPVLAQVRQGVWSETFTVDDVMIPRGAGFAAQSLGFVTPGASSEVFRNGSWMRISNARGHVVIRRAASLL